MIGQIPSPYESTLTPEAYLEFAIEDAKDPSDRGKVNAFTNIKRSLHLAVDTLLHQYGLFTRFKKIDFPNKLSILDSIEVLPTTIVRNLNIERNLVEHEYEIPSGKRVQEAIDVLKLLLMARGTLLEGTPHEAVVGWRNPKKHLVLRLEPMLGEIQLFTLRAKGKYRRSEGVYHFCGNLRTFSGDEYCQGVSVARRPWKTIELNKQTMTTWAPIIRELVAVQRKNRLATQIGGDTVVWRTTITVPFALPEGVSWCQILDDFMKQPLGSEADHQGGEGEADLK
jgi:hypothetical protein